MDYPARSIFLSISLWAVIIFCLFKCNIEEDKFASDADQITVQIGSSEAKNFSTKNFFPKSNLKSQEKVDQKNDKNLKDKKDDVADEASSQAASQHNHNFSDDQIIYHPLPEIPGELRREAFNSYAIARFYIAEDGSVANVDLIKPCANPRLNHLLMQKLKMWKFSTAKSYKKTRDVKIFFEVK